MELGTDVGAPTRNCVLSRTETAEASATELTENTGWTQARPPEPADEAKSTISGLHPIRVLATGVVHSYPPSHRAHLGSIPGRFMIASMSFIQTALAEVLMEEMEDQGSALRASIAWNKMLMLTTFM